MQLDTSTTLSPITRMLHWIVGVGMISLLAIGVFMAETKTYSLYSWHKSFGFIIFFVVLLRVLWRIKNGWPSPAGNYTPIEHILSKLVHWLLILGTLLLPISGFLMSSLGGNGVDVFGLEIVARNVAPANPQKALAHYPQIASFFHSVHHWAGYAIIASVFLHVAGALKHHIIDKDNTLKRMLKG
ncbi:cytochrome b [uncultured Shewanella sp.]|uniref:cytochrome b n=1 Tax=uncultured Shewanella sp. TaxID=173975 RepID=UPI00261D4BAC|nr:cytochrome b [uncultured Shewanella sp.]